jgi:hypothetical protein
MSDKPKAFISYSWTSPSHQNTVKEWADRLLSDGVEVILDIYDLKEGHDKYAFMERMATDPTVTHVLVFSDKVYAEKADARKAGVGTESQIISREVYEKIDQSKFIPIACELDPEGEAYLPTFFKGRICIDFSSAEAANKNWEQLIRLLHGKPAFLKPSLGKAPAYLRDEARPADPASTKFLSLKQAILTGKPTLDLYRQEFLDTCIEFVDAMRIRERVVIGEDEDFAERILADADKMKVIRDHVVDWVVLEGKVNASSNFQAAMLAFLERLALLKGRPREMQTWNEQWYEAPALFVFETFLYVVASLMKVGAWEILHEVLASHYLQTEPQEHFESIWCFYTGSDSLQSVLASPGRQLYSPVGELLKRHADRQDLPFQSIVEADLLVFLAALVNPAVDRWFPQLIYYVASGSFPLFIRATRHRDFQKLATVTGIPDGDALRVAVEKGMERMGVHQWHEMNFRLRLSFAECLNLKSLDTIK